MLRKTGSQKLKRAVALLLAISTAAAFALPAAAETYYTDDGDVEVVQDGYESCVTIYQTGTANPISEEYNAHTDTDGHVVITQRSSEQITSQISLVDISEGEGTKQTVTIQDINIKASPSYDGMWNSGVDVEFVGENYIEGGDLDGYGGAGIWIDGESTFTTVDGTTHIKAGTATESGSQGPAIAGNDLTLENGSFEFTGSNCDAGYIPPVIDLINLTIIDSDVTVTATHEAEPETAPIAVADNFTMNNATVEIDNTNGNSDAVPYDAGLTISCNDNKIIATNTQAAGTAIAEKSGTVIVAKGSESVAIAADSEADTIVKTYDDGHKDIIVINKSALAKALNKYEAYTDEEKVKFEEALAENIKNNPDVNEIVLLCNMLGVSSDTLVAGAVGVSSDGKLFIIKDVSKIGIIDAVDEFELKEEQAAGTNAITNNADDTVILKGEDFASLIISELGKYNPEIAALAAPDAETVFENLVDWAVKKGVLDKDEIVRLDDMKCGKIALILCAILGEKAKNEKDALRILNEKGVFDGFSIIDTITLAEFEAELGKFVKSFLK